MAKREAVLDNVVSVLEDITVENGYNYTMRKVTRESFNWQNLQDRDYPAAIVQMVSEDKDGTGLQGQHIIASMNITVRSALPDGDNIEEDINLLTDDVEKAMCADTYRGGTAILTVPVRIQMFQWQDKVFFDFIFRIDYQYLYGSPE
jgi:hypothetical protein